MEKELVKKCKDFKQEREKQHLKMSDILDRLSDKGILADEKTIRRLEKGENMERFSDKLRLIQEYSRILGMPLEMFEKPSDNPSDEKLEKILKILIE